MAKTLQTVKMADILPPNLLADTDVQAIAKAIDSELALLVADIVQCLHLPRLEDLPEIVIDLLAWQFHTDFYESTLPLAQKCALVKNSIAWHRRKGTPDVVQETVLAVFPSGETREWFQYGGEPYKFRVETSDLVSGTGSYDKLIRLITAVKNTRSWLESIRVNRVREMPIYVGIAEHVFKKTTIYPQS